MKNLIRDFKILWDATWYVLKFMILADVLFLLAIYTIESSSPAGSYLLTFQMFLIMVGVVNSIVIGGMIYTYLTVWRKEIQLRINEAEREKKYNFISQRFNDIN